MCHLIGDALHLLILACTLSISIYRTHCSLPQSPSAVALGARSCCWRLTEWIHTTLPPPPWPPWPPPVIQLSLSLFQLQTAERAPSLSDDDTRSVCAVGALPPLLRHRLGLREKAHSPKSEANHLSNHREVPSSPYNPGKVYDQIITIHWTLIITRPLEEDVIFSEYQ